MFNLRTGRGWAALISALTLLVTMVACAVPEVDDGGYYYAESAGFELSYVDKNGDPMPAGKAMRASTGEVVDVAGGPRIDTGEDVADLGDFDGLDDEGAEGAEDAPEPDPAVAAEPIVIVESPIEVVFGSCHTSQTQGSASDGWIWFLFPNGLPDGIVVAADVTMQDGVSQRFTGLALAPDQVTTVVPLEFFGQEVTVDALFVGDEQVPLDDFDTTFEVDPTSDCTYMP